ncbi:MAG TPA: sialidase family protein [Candidatus Binatia bacterium]|nr:sialidase family protein [Candidatus Binatia bacterium]
MSYARLAIALASTINVSAVAFAAEMPVFEHPALLPGLRDQDHTALSSELGYQDREPRLATDGDGTWIAVWTSGNSLSGTIGGDNDVLYARSTDGGRSFTPPSPINDAVGDTYTLLGSEWGVQDRRADIATDGNGTWTVVWYRDAGVYRYITVSRSTDDGVSWGTGQDIGIRSTSPSIATDGAGTWIIAWRVESPPGDNSEFQYARSADDGATWSEPETINTGVLHETGLHFTPRVRWANGVWMFTWTSGRTLTVEGHDGGNPRGATISEIGLYNRRSFDGGVTWTSPHRMARTERPREIGGHDLASDGDGNWIAVWHAYDRIPDPDQPPAYLPPANHEVWSVRSGDDGATWHAAVRINLDDDARGDSHESAPVVTFGVPGTAMAAWSRSGDATTALGLDADLVGVLSEDAGASWSLPAPVNNTATVDESSSPARAHDDFEPVLAYDAEGHWLAAWSADYPPGGTRTHRRLATALTNQLCGNSILDAGEDCDDEPPRDDGDCCTRTCSFDVALTLCTSDDDVCTIDRCDGAGTCLHDHEPRTACAHSLSSRGSSISIDRNANSLSWVWKEGEAMASRAIGDPQGFTDYGLCLYDGASNPLMQAYVPAQTTCSRGLSCWRYTSKGATFSNGSRMPDGIGKIAIKTGGDRKSSARVSASGPDLVLPPTPIDPLPLRVQLVNNNGSCWEASFSGNLQNDTDGFRAKGQ